MLFLQPSFFFFASLFRCPRDNVPSFLLSCRITLLLLDVEHKVCAALLLRVWLNFPITTANGEVFVVNNNI